MECLNAEALEHISTNTWIQNNYVCTYCSLNASRECKLGLGGQYIRCHLARCSAARGPYIKKSPRAPVGPTYADVSRSVLDEPFLKYKMGAVYEILLTLVKLFIGWSGRHINYRLEHAVSIKTGTVISTVKFGVYRINLNPKIKLPASLFQIFSDLSKNREPYL